MDTTHTLIFFSLLLLSASTMADANDGDYLGFKLGEKYSVPRGSVGTDHITGALSYAVDAHHRHQHMGSLSIYVSPKSSIIGNIFGGWYFSSERAAKAFSDRYMQSLENKYSNWKRRRNTLTNGEYQLWVDVERKPQVVDHWPSGKNFRVGVALSFARKSEPRSVWMAMIQAEVEDLQLRAGN
jgi:hypothetical protein